MADRNRKFQPIDIDELDFQLDDDEELNLQREDDDPWDIRLDDDDKPELQHEDGGNSVLQSKEESDTQAEDDSDLRAENDSDLQAEDDDDQDLQPEDDDEADRQREEERERRLAERRERSRKKARRARLLLALMCTAALLVVAGIVFLIVFISRSGKNVSGQKLEIVTKNGGHYLNDEQGVLVEKSDECIIFPDLETALYSLKDKWYYVKNGEKVQIGSSKVTIEARPEQELTWVLYSIKSGDTFLFRPGQADLILFEGAAPKKAVFSRNGRYLAVSFAKDKEYTLFQIDTQNGEVQTLFQEKKTITLRAVDNTGCVYYQDADKVYHVADGNEDLILEGVTAVKMQEDLFLVAKTDAEENVTYYTREFGLRADLKPLEGAIDAGILTAARKSSTCWSVLKPSQAYGISAESGDAQNVTDKLMVQYDGDIFFVDLKAGTAVMMMEDAALSKIDGFRMTEDMKTAYVLVKECLYKLTSNKNGWKKERLSKHCSEVLRLTDQGLIYVENNAVMLHDGRKTTEKAQFESCDACDISEDMKSAVCLNGKKVMYISNTGAEAEQLAKDNGGEQVLLFGDSVYYITKKNELIRVRPGQEPETVMKSVQSISVIGK